MNSRERARKFRKIMNIIFDDEDEDDLVELLDQHAAEARAEQRGACADKFDFEEDQLLASTQQERVMNSEERVSKFLSEPIRVEDFRTALVNLLDAHAEEQREKVAAWMIHNGYSTGHGDTIEELLEEFEWQWDKALKKQREACEAAMYHAVRKYMPQDFPLDIVSEAILNARVEKSDDKNT